MAIRLERVRHCNTRQSSEDSWRGVLIRKAIRPERARHCTPRWHPRTTRKSDELLLGSRGGHVEPTRTCASLQHPSIIRGLMARRADPQVHPTRTCASLQHPSIIRRLIARRADPQHEFCQLSSPHGTYLLRVTQGRGHAKQSVLRT